MLFRSTAAYVLDGATDTPLAYFDLSTGRYVFYDPSRKVTEIGEVADWDRWPRTKAGARTISYLDYSGAREETETRIVLAVEDVDRPEAPTKFFAWRRSGRTYTNPEGRRTTSSIELGELVRTAFPSEQANIRLPAAAPSSTR